MVDGTDLDFRICFTFNNAEFMREIRFRAWHNKLLCMEHDVHMLDRFADIIANPEKFVLMQYSGIKDKDKNPIFEGDVLEFADKWEWYKGSYGIKMYFADEEKKKELMKKYADEPMERRVIELPEDYQWLLSGEIQTYWHVIGNVWQNPELIKQ